MFGCGIMTLPYQKDKVGLIMAKKMLFVMNPYAGMRKGSRYLADIISIFNQGGYEVVTYMTAGTGDATRIAR